MRSYLKKTQVRMNTCSLVKVCSIRFKIYLHHYITPSQLLILQTTTDWEGEVEIEITADEDCHKPDPYDDVYSNIPNTHTCSRRKKIADYAEQKNSNTKLSVYAAGKDR